MHLEFADWILAAVSFVAGTIVPVIYARLTFDAISLRQPFDVRGVFQDERDKRRKELVFSTLVKIANAQGKPLIIDDIRADSVHGQTTDFEFIGIDLRASKPGGAFHLPPHSFQNNALDYLPLLIKDNSECIITLGIWFRYSELVNRPDTSDSTPTDALMQMAEEPGLKVHFRINGKYRRYVLHAKPSERWKKIEV